MTDLRSPSSPATALPANQKVTFDGADGSSRLAEAKLPSSRVTVFVVFV